MPRAARTAKVEVVVTVEGVEVMRTHSVLTGHPLAALRGMADPTIESMVRGAALRALPSGRLVNSPQLRKALSLVHEANVEANDG